MKTTPAAFARRTGLAYDPPPPLRAVARPLQPDEPCPTLFRYPGPLGLRRMLAGESALLAPDASPWVWLAETLDGTCARAASLFGGLALLDPLRLEPCVSVEAGAYLGVNRLVREGAESIWIPSSARSLPWDEIETVDQARDRLGTAYEGARQAAADALCAYLEELSALERAAAVPPSVPWHEVEVAERRALLERHGVRPTWTDGFG